MELPREQSYYQLHEWVNEISSSAGVILFLLDAGFMAYDKDRVENDLPNTPEEEMRIIMEKCYRIKHEYPLSSLGSWGE